MPLAVIRDPRPAARDTVLAIGSFDGVHQGHRALLDRVVREAGELGIAPAVLTFEPLPRELLFPDRAPPRLSSLSAKLHAFAEAGIEIAYLCRFNRAFAALDAAGVFAAPARDAWRAPRAGRAGFPLRSEARR